MKRLSRFVAIVGLGLILFGCTTTAAGPSIPEGTITFKRYDGRPYLGTVHGHGPTAIILANMSYGLETQWQPFVDSFDQEKFTVVTFNYLQNIQTDYPSAEQEVQIVLDTLKSHGFKRVICMGASMGATVCGYIAHATEMVGIALISGRNAGGSLDTTYPKLFISARLDPESTFIESAYNSAPDPKTLIIYTDTANHGTDLFYAPASDPFLQSLLDFVNNIP